MFNDVVVQFSNDFRSRFLGSHVTKQSDAYYNAQTVTLTDDLFFRAFRPHAKPGLHATTGGRRIVSGAALSRLQL